VAAGEAATDAEVLARHVLGWDRATYLARRRDPAPAGFESRYAPLAARRERREPVSIITGRREFWGLEFAVGPAVLTPRPETELIVETALDLLGTRRDAPLAIADVGTGSGCLAVTLAREFPRAVVTAVDVSAAALAVARRNAATHGVAGRIHWVEAPLADWLAGSAPGGEAAGPARDRGGGGEAPGGGNVRIDLPPASRPHDTRVWPGGRRDGRRIDLLVANLPYVPTGEVGALPPEVSLHEPRIALDGGPDGLGPLRDLLRAAPLRLQADARVILEIGQGQADALRDVAAAAPGLRLVDIRPDLRGIPRTAVIAPAAPAACEASAAQEPRGGR
jgi:release factor glutamine methyltransferase